MNDEMIAAGVAALRKFSSPKRSEHSVLITNKYLPKALTAAYNAMRALEGCEAPPVPENVSSISAYLMGKSE